MATWSGWVAQFLTEAHLTNTDGTRTFLTQWASFADSSCRNNPVDVSRSRAGSTNCHKLTASRTAQNYTSHANAAAAFNLELHSGNFAQLLAGFTSGDPYTIAKLPGVIADLNQWGSSKFAAHLTTEFGLGGGAGSGNRDTHAVAAWTDVRTTVNRNLPTALRRIDKLNAGALSKLGRRGRVKH